MAQRKNLSLAQRAWLLAIARARLADPGDRALSQALGVSVRDVQYHLRRWKLRISATAARSGAVIPRAWALQSRLDAAAISEPDRPDEPLLAEADSQDRVA